MSGNPALQRRQWRYSPNAARRRTDFPGNSSMSAIAEPIRLRARPTTAWRAATPWCWRWRRRSPAATTPSSSRPPRIVGAVLAPDKGLATLPITAMVIGMWLGTLPVGALARRFGRRFALQTGSVFGILSGLISYSAVMQRHSSGCCCSARSAAGSMPPRISPIASPPPTPRARPTGPRSCPGCWPAACSPR